MLVFQGVERECLARLGPQAMSVVNRWTPICLGHLGVCAIYSETNCNRLGGLGLDPMVPSSSKG